MGLQPKFTRDVVTNKMSLYDCDKYWNLERKEITLESPLARDLNSKLK